MRRQSSAAILSALMAVGSLHLESAPSTLPIPLVQGTQAAAESLEINLEPIGCVIAGKDPMIDATIEPAAHVARARLYFKSALSNDWFYSEMDLHVARGRAGGRQDLIFRGWLPRPTVKESPITIYVLATTADLTESRSPGMSINVVEHKTDCQGRVAPFGGPPEGLTFFPAAARMRGGGGPITNLREEIGPDRLDRMQAATRLEVFGVRMKGDGDWKLVGKGRHMSDDFRRRLVGVLSDTNSYLDVATLCGFEPGVAYRFWKGSTAMDVLICFKCNELCFGSNGECETSIFFDPARARLVRLAKEALPDNRGILSLKEKEE